MVGSAALAGGGRAFMDGLTRGTRASSHSAPSSSLKPTSATSPRSPIRGRFGFRLERASSSSGRPFRRTAFRAVAHRLGPLSSARTRPFSRAKTYGLIGPGRRFRVVVPPPPPPITDGEPNCGSIRSASSSWPLHGKSWASRYAIGLPGSEQAAAFPDQLASAGGGYEAAEFTTPDETSGGVAVVVDDGAGSRPPQGR